jgi:hypothetical protein
MIFEKRETIQASLLQKLLWQLPDENAIIELNNLLAAMPIKDISGESLRAIEQKYRISLRQHFRLNLEEFYLVYLNHCLGVDGRLSESNRNDLQHLRDILGFDLSDIETLHHTLGVHLYRSLFSRLLSNSGSSKGIETKLEILTQELLLSQKHILALRQEEFTNYSNAFFKRILEKNRFSRNEEDSITKVSRDIGVELVVDKETAKKLKQAKLLWELQNLDLPATQVSISLQKNETCYFHLASVNWYEFRSVRGIKSPKFLYSGKIYLTNKRLIFESSEKSIAVKLTVVQGVFEYENCIEVRKENGRSPLLEFKEHDEFAIVMDRLLRGNVGQAR